MYSVTKLIRIQRLCDLNWIRDYYELEYARPPPPNSKHQRLWFFPGELLSAKVTVAGSGLVNWLLQTQFPVKETVNITLLYWQKKTEFAAMK